MSSKSGMAAVVNDQAFAAWAGRHWVGLCVVGFTEVAVEVALVHDGLQGLTFAGLVVVGVLAWAAKRLVGVAVWWNRRRRLLARHSLPALGFVATLGAMREERKRVRYVTKQWAAFCQEHNLLGVGKTVPRLHDMKGTVSGDLTARITPGKIGVKTTAGMTAVERIRSFAPGLAEVTGCREVSVDAIRDQHTAVVTFYWTERLERILPVAEMPTVGEGRDNEVVFGTWADGASPATLRMCEPALVGGMTGSGKSGFVWAGLADLLRKGTRTDLYVCNNKGGAELRAFAKVEGQTRGPFRIVKYGRDIPDTVRIIAQFEKDMKARAGVFPHRQWKPEHAAEWPLALLIIDESVELMLKMDTKQRAVLDTCISQGRANGFWPVMLSQKAQVSVLKDTRDFIPQRFSLAQATRINTEMFLGDGAEEAGAACSRIVDRPGMGYAFDETRRGYHLFRAAWVDDDDMARIANGELPTGMELGVRKGEVNRQCAVYRFFNALGVLLYVGITVDLEARWAKHAADKPWWPEVDMSRTLVTWHPSEAVARSIEEREIKTRYPRYNKQHNGANPLAATAAPEPRPEPSPAPRPAAPATSTAAEWPQVPGRRSGRRVGTEPSLAAVQPISSARPVRTRAAQQTTTTTRTRTRRTA